ncbi:MAG: His/Gly/Thr/Pro-type tRNA ligase C-terminal domain-containing protein, partial [Sphaerochaetaceae bacterium]|nr:His/Gly/Thr/Pro-type tRNA ligase C-terminal domain-containing protein [Sphaerochaetaceae bacterium]
NDDQGLKLPLAVAPYQIHLISLIKDTKVSDEIYHKLKHAGFTVLYDDRKGSAGVKFSDADLIGLPLRLTLGNRSLKEGQIEAKLRKDLSKGFDIELNNIIHEVKTLLDEA